MSVGLQSGKYNNCLCAVMRSRLVDLKELRLLSLLWVLSAVFVSCDQPVEHTAPAVNDKDSVPMMVSYGVNTLISDSGVIKYRIVTERWEVNQNKKPSRWYFDKGLFLEQFDEKFHVEAYIQCDTAYYFDQQRLWELRSRVRILTKDGLRFSSEQLYWDEIRHELYSYTFSRLVTPERTLQGTYFRSDEKMTKYFVSNSKGSFERDDFGGGEQTTGDSSRKSQDSLLMQQRGQMVPYRYN